MIPGIANISSRVPVIRIAGKPTEMILSDGAERVIIPRPALINSTEMSIGNAITRPPKNRSGDHSINTRYTSSKVKASLTAMESKLYSSS